MLKVLERVDADIVVVGEYFPMQKLDFKDILPVVMRRYPKMRIVVASESAETEAHPAYLAGAERVISLNRNADRDEAAHAVRQLFR